MKKLISICLILLASACSRIGKDSTDGVTLIVDSASSCPHFTTSHKNEIVLSYVKDLNDSVSVLKFVYSKDGENFNVAQTISGTENVYPHGENLPKVIFQKNGYITAVWGTQSHDPRNKYAGRIFYARSFDAGKSWQKPEPLVKDTAGFDQRYFDLALLPDGEVGIIWLDNRESEKMDGSSIYFARTNDRSGFIAEKRVHESICPCCRTDLIVDSKGTLHLAYRDIINDSIRDMVHVFSSDNGRTFSNPQRISADNWVINACPHTGPSMTENKNGLHFSWYTGGEPAGVFYCSSDLAGKKFNHKDSVSRNASAKHPQIRSLPDGKLVIAWDQTVKTADNFYARIFLQIRDAEGKTVSSKAVSPDNAVSEFPVLTTFNKKILLAYTQRKDEKRYIAFVSASQ